MPTGEASGALKRRWHRNAAQRQPWRRQRQQRSPRPHALVWLVQVPAEVTWSAGRAMVREKGGYQGLGARRRLRWRSTPAAGPLPERLLKPARNKEFEEMGHDPGCRCNNTMEGAGCWETKGSLWSVTVIRLYARLGALRQTAFRRHPPSEEGAERED
eukprot:scaffold28641_cov31-Tisochrysis_lutea.AAC.4